jgi:hypothetical protein
MRLNLSSRLLLVLTFPGTALLPALAQQDPGAAPPVQQQQGKITGQITHADGTPVAGAGVALAGFYPLNLVTSGPDGRFTLSNLPTGEVTLIAAKEYAFSRQSATTGADIKIALQNRPAPNADDGEKLLLAQPGGWPHLEAMGVVPPLDPDFALSLLPRDQQGFPNPAQVALIIKNLARRAPATAATWGLAQWAKLPPKSRTIEYGAFLAGAIAPLNPQPAAAWLVQARAQLKPNDFSADAANNLISLAGVAGALNDPSAGDILDLGLTAADRSVLGNNRIRAADNWGRAVAASPDLLVRLIDGLRPIEQVSALAGAIQVMAPRDLDVAQGLMEWLMRIYPDPSIQAADAQQVAERANGDFHELSPDVLGRAQTEVALALAGKPGPEALNMAKPISDARLRETAVLEVARRHARAGRTAEATEALRFFATEKRYWPSNSAEGAGIALTFDKALAKELFLKETARIFDPKFDNTNAYRPSPATYALYHAPIDPAQSRLILENEWAWLQAQGGPQPQNNGGNQRGSVVAGNQNSYLLVKAMGTLDLPRALEMLDQVKDQFGENDDTKMLLGLFLKTGGKIELLGLLPREDF